MNRKILSAIRKYGFLKKDRNSRDQVSLTNDYSWISNREEQAIKSFLVYLRTYIVLYGFCLFTIFSIEDEKIVSDSPAVKLILINSEVGSVSFVLFSIFSLSGLNLFSIYGYIRIFFYYRLAIQYGRPREDTFPSIFVPPVEDSYPLLNRVLEFISILFMWFSLPLFLTSIAIKGLKTNDKFFLNFVLILLVFCSSFLAYSWNTAQKKISPGNSNTIWKWVLFIIYFSIALLLSFLSQLSQFDNRHVREHYFPESVSMYNLFKRLSRPDLSGSFFEKEDLRNLNLSRVNFLDTNFQKTNFRGTTLEDAIFAQSYFHTVNFQGTQLYLADFGGATIVKSDFYGARIYHASFSGATIEDSKFLGGILARTWWHGCKISGSDFSFAQLPGADFSNCEIENTSFKSAHLAGSNFNNAKLRNVDFLGADLSGASFLIDEDSSNVIVYGQHLNFSRIHRTIIDKLRIQAVEKSVCNKPDFERVDFSIYTPVPQNPVYYKPINPRGACLVGIDLSALKLNWFDFTGANLNGANLSRVEANDFKGASLKSVNFSGAKISGANFEGADLSEANFSGSDLRGAKLMGAELGRANFSKARIPNHVSHFLGADFGRTTLPNGKLCSGSSCAQKMAAMSDSYYISQ